MTCSISCVIPTYNTAHYVDQAIESVLGQTFPAAEIVVVDDGSTDDTTVQLARFGDAITVIHQTNQGVSAARNAGVAAAKGEYITFLDADDVFAKDKFERQSAAFIADPGLLFCDGFTSYFWSPELSAERLAADHRYSDTFWQTPVAGHISSWFLRRDVMKTVGPFEVGCGFSEDTDWFLRCEALDLPRARLDQTLSARRLHPDNVTRSNRDEQIAGLFHAIRRKRARSN